MLKCYTLTSKAISVGIEVDAYESIVAEPGTKLITAACIHLIPVLDGINTVDPEDFAQVASSSLAFICAENSSKTTSDSGILLSLNPSEWSLTFDKAHIVLLDPAGVHNKILVYVQAGTKYHIQHRREPKTLFVDDECNLSIHSTNRASLFMKALSLPVLKINPPDNTRRASQASAKKRSSNRRSNQRGR